MLVHGFGNTAGKGVLNLLLAALLLSYSPAGKARPLCGDPRSQLASATAQLQQHPNYQSLLLLLCQLCRSLGKGAAAAQLY